MFFRYTNFLERQNELLNSRIEALESRNQELVLALISKTQSVSLPLPKSEKKHTITRKEDSASCTCGWITHVKDPIELQEAISSHYRQFTIQSGRKTWSQIKTEAEAAGIEEK